MKIEFFDAVNEEERKQQLRAAILCDAVLLACNEDAELAEAEVRNLIKKKIKNKDWFVVEFTARQNGNLDPNEVQTVCVKIFDVVIEKDPWFGDGEKNVCQLTNVFEFTCDLLSFILAEFAEWRE